MKKLTQADFQERRAVLAGEMGLRSIAVIATSPVAMRNRDADYKFRADSSFFYLTGFAEPEAVAVIETFDTAEEGYSYSLFCRERNREMEIWNGYRAGIDGAVDDYDADEAYAIDLLDEEIVAKLLGKEKIFYRIAEKPEFDTRVNAWLKKAEQQPRNCVRSYLTEDAVSTFHGRHTDNDIMNSYLKSLQINEKMPHCFFSILL